MSPATDVDVDVDALGSITGDVWSAFVCEDAVVLPVTDLPPCEDADITGLVRIEGDLSGCVFVRCDRGSAASLARRLFRLDPGDEVEDRDITDALGEMANIIGGNVKSLGLGESRLTLPEVGAAGVIEPGGTPVCAADVIWEDGRATLAVGPGRQQTESTAHTVQGTPTREMDR